MKSNYNLLIEKIGEYNQLEVEICKVIKKTIIEDIKVLGERFPIIDRFISAMGSILLIVKSPLDNEEEFMFSILENDIAECENEEIQKIVNDETFKNLNSFINEWNDKFFIYGYGFKQERKTNFIPINHW